MSIPTPPEVRVIQADNRGRLALNPWTDRHAQYTVERHADGTLVIRPLRFSEGGIVHPGEYVIPHRDLPAS